MRGCRIKNIEIPELDDAETNPPENHKENGTTPLVNTQPLPPHSPVEDASVASYAPPPHQRVEAVNDSLQEQEGYLPDVHLLSTNYMLYGIYQYWVHQNQGDHLDGGIAEDSKWQARWKKIVCMPTQRYDAPYGKFGNRFVGILSIELDGVRATKWNDGISGLIRTPATPTR